MMPVKPPASTAMLVSVARSSRASRHAGAAELEHLADAVAALEELLAEQVQHHVLGADARGAACRAG
jgi:hypothetical protein